MKFSRKYKTFTAIFMALLLTLVLLSFIPQVTATPQVLPLSSATVFVSSGVGDYFQFSTGGPISFTAIGSSFTITSPDGREATITKIGPVGVTNSPCTPEKWSLSGIFINGVIDTWSFNGDLTGAAVDGTWQITVNANGEYASTDDGNEACFRPGPSLVVGGRTLHYGFASVQPNTLHQAWNWPYGSWTEPSTVPIYTPNNDIPNEAANEDPNNAIFYSSAFPSCIPQDLEPTPSGPPVATDADSDGVPGYYTTPTNNRHVNANCSITTTTGTPIITDGPDPDDSDPGNPSSVCVEEDIYTPSGDAIITSDADGDGVQGPSTYTEDKRHVNADCSITVTPDARTQTVAGPDPDDNDINNPRSLEANTLNFVITCSATPTMTITGAWLNALGNAFSKHVYRQGNFVGTTDLRSIIFSVTTVEENEGATPAGTDTEASIPYDNAAGTSYQFIIRTVLQGEALGIVAIAPPLQCSSSTPAIALTDNHNEEIYDLTVSQAQCANDFVSFSTDIDIGNILTVVVSNIITVQNAMTGTTVVVIPTANLYSVGNKVDYTAKVFAPGAYTAIGKLVLTGVGAGVFFDSAAFNVPVGDCIWHEPDLSNVLAAVSVVNNNVIASNSSLHEHLNTSFTNVNDHLNESFAYTWNLINSSTDSILVDIDGLNATMQLEFINNLAAITELINGLNVTMQGQYDSLLQYLIGFNLTMQIQLADNLAQILSAINGLNISLHQFITDNVNILLAANSYTNTLVNNSFEGLINQINYNDIYTNNLINETISDLSGSHVYTNSLINSSRIYVSQLMNSSFVYSNDLLNTSVIYIGDLVNDGFLFTNTHIHSHFLYTNALINDTQALINSNTLNILAAINGLNITNNNQYLSLLAAIEVVNMNLTMHNLTMTQQHMLINASLTNIYNAIQDIDLVFNITDSNITFEIDNDTLQQIANNTYHILTNITEHREFTLEIFTLQNITLLVILLLFIITWILAEWKRDALYFLLASLMALIGLVTSPIFNGIRSIFIALLVYLIIRLYLTVRGGFVKTETE